MQMSSSEHPSDTSEPQAIGCGKVTAEMKLRFAIAFALLASGAHNELESYENGP
jgi:hypothetical protein